MHETVLRMPSSKKCHHILRLATVYRRFFSVLIFNVELENITEVNINAKVITRKWPGIFVLLVVTAVAALATVIQIIFPNSLSFTEHVTLSLVALSHYVTFVFPLIYSMFNYRKIHYFWCKVYETACFAFSELGFEISFQWFWKRFFVDTVICAVTLILHGSCRIWFHSPRTHYARQYCTTFLQETIIYIIVHALFMVNLNSFFIRLLIKYIDLDHQNRTSNLIFDHGERSLLHQLRLYKQFHYKLWEMTTAVNGFFGLTLLILSYHAFVDVSYAAYYVFFCVALGKSILELMCNLFIFTVRSLILFGCILFLAPMASILSAAITTVVLINACHSCATQVNQYRAIEFVFPNIIYSIFICSKKLKLMTNVEKLTFWINDNEKLHYAKQDLTLQISNLDVSINGNDYFIVNRKYLAGVSCLANTNN